MAECCGKGVRLVYSCSGAADVGEISDRVARLLVKRGFAKPSCLAGVGAHVSGFIASAQGEVENIVIDGCPVACAQKTLKHVGAGTTCYVLTDMGLKKGQASGENQIVEQIAEIIMAKAPALSKSPAQGGCACGSC